MSALKPKHQRLVLVILALVAIIGAGLIAAWSLRNQANYFYLPDQLVEAPPSVGQAVRLGGMVAEGSLQTLPDGVTIAFEVTDQEEARVPVRYRGIVPDLFVEGSGVVAEGSLDASGTFVATNLLAKHDENYVPRELQEMSEHQAAKMAEETTVGLE
ncbi:cytochrome c-type biogenesis protein CcmE [Altererythrobacter xiamenensis]|uniref:Cytochrome c-type biogenesis protein CcmE n=1 Tax=Altererythrobacter xiamenensis TaxID=1316679 RepID=A0A1Y6FN87_9SPHN|nr:cytochrome c maturation protein CcmE [Altererythrobacter xiamenensis]SMQ73883.1 cytochrome c-type biogenesis protein CcmE [Altererythrobacter xiamenensis]